MDGHMPGGSGAAERPEGGRRGLAGWRRAAAGAAAVAIAGALAPLAVAGVAGAAPGGAGTLYVSTTGSSTGTCTSGNPCSTIGYALFKAVATDTVLVAHGTYKESATAAHLNVVPSTKHGIVIERNSATTTTTPVVVTATGETFGLQVQASTVTVTGLTVQNALMSGIRVSPLSTTTAKKAATPLTAVTISNVDVLDNDKCTASPTAATCKAAAAATPHSDFGEGLHLETVATSKVTTSTVQGNSGGIYLTDEHGPTHGITVSKNDVVDNSLDCGITLASHNPNAVFTTGPTTGKDHPTAGGVYGNTVMDNTSSSNGDSGVLLAAPMPGAATYSNTVTGNTLDSNGHAGVTIHSHAPLQDVNGNVIKGNSLASDALEGDSSVALTRTAAIVVYSAAGAITGTQITGNTISHVFYGVWMSSPSLVAKGTTITGNNVSVTAGGSATYTQPDPNTGYFEAGRDGAVYAFGAAVARGSMVGTPLAAPVVGMATTPDKGGYWLVASDGGIFAFGDANFYGSMGGKALNAPIVAITATPDGKGYWEVASDGGIFSFGDAVFYGSMGGKPLNKPIVGIASSPDGKGYWEVASDGGIFSFGDATFYGSMGGKPLNEPMVGMTATTTGKGYWTVASDGGIFSFGDATFYGSMGGKPLNRPIVAMEAVPTGKGYWMVASDGGIFAFGTAGFFGSNGGKAISAPIVAMSQV